MSVEVSVTKTGDGITSLYERRVSWLEAARLYLVCDTTPAGRPLEEVLRPALQNGVNIAQLRDKNSSENDLKQAGEVFRRLCDAYDALFIVNDRPDIALVCAADGVHLGQEDLSVKEVRRLVGPDLVIGLSTHSPEQIEGAEGCDYISVGPVHRTPTKPEYEPVGLDLVRQAAQSASSPYFAIGGINAENVHDVLDAGAERVAVVRAIAEAEDPAEATRKLHRAIEGELSS